MQEVKKYKESLRRHNKECLNRHLHLIEAFKWLEMNEERIRIHLEQVIPEYIKTGREIKNALKKI